MTITLGIEEEVFVTEPIKPSLNSLYYLGKLFWHNPSFYYKRSSSNFARGKDIKEGLMSGVEITTDVHNNIESLIEDFQLRRKELCKYCEGLIIPMGHLITYDTPTNVCALQIHLGNLINKKNTYYNIAYFLPLLLLLTASSPLVKGNYFGYSYRIASGYAIGVPDKEPSYRFQDIIFSKRLGTIEVKIFDPWWDLERIKLIVKALLKIAQIKKSLLFNLEDYKRLRDIAVTKGYAPEIKHLYQELSKYYFIPESYFQKPPADEIMDLYKKYGILGTYSALDNAYRYGIMKPRKVKKFKKNPLKVTAGFLGYFIPRIPYRLWKYWRDWY